MLIGAIRCYDNACLVPNACLVLVFRHMDPATFNHRVRIEPGQTHTYAALIDRTHHIGTQW